VNLDEIREFAKVFKLRRLALGLTQTQVGQALSATKGPAYSQSAICRFEKLDITPKSAAKIKPVLEKWMQEAELKYADRLKNGTPQNFADLLGSESSKKRKRRTSFTPQALEVLSDAFDKNTHPSGTDMTILSNKLNYDREVIRVWFCNKRQALKNNIKKFKPGEVPNGNGLIANITSSNGGNLFVSGLGSTSNCDDSNASDSDIDEIEGTQQLKKEKNNHQQQQQQHNDSLSAAVAAAVAAATS
jgi:POU domain transcription factor, class 6